MSDAGSSVTLIVYSLGSDWWTGAEPFLNVVAAAAQRSNFTHVELAIGEVRAARATRETQKETRHIRYVCQNRVGSRAYPKTVTPLLILSLVAHRTLAHAARWSTCCACSTMQWA